MTQNPPPPDDSFFSSFGNDLYEPADSAAAWPDLASRSLTNAERTALLNKASHIHQAVEHFDSRLLGEEKLRSAAPALFDDHPIPPYLPSELIPLIYVPLNFARRALEAQRNDEAAVANLRIAETLARLLHTWRDPIWEERIDELIGSTESLAVAMPKEGRYISTSMPVEA